MHTAFNSPPSSPVTRSRCLSVWVMTRVYLYVCARARMCKCISRWHNTVAPNLTSPHRRGPGAVTPGTRAGKHSANMNERSRGPDVYVCVCVYTVFLVCQSSKCMQLLRLHWKRQSDLVQGYITQILATFSIGCVIEFHIAAVSRKLPSFSFLVCVSERERAV